MASCFQPFLLPSIFVFLYATVALAAPSAPPPAGDCSTLILALTDCLTFVVVGGSASKPEGKCCSGLKTVIETDARCLCEELKNSAQLGVTLNVTKALTLPAACNLKAAPIGDCGLSNAPSAAPGLPPSGRAQSPTSGAAGPGTNKASPALAPGGGRSGSPRLASSLELLLKGGVMSAATVSIVLF